MRMDKKLCTKEIRAKARKLFGSDDAVREWLYSEAQALGFQKPVDAMRSEEGLQKVRELLGRIEYGIYT